MLPEGIEEILPDEARRLEQLRRRLLDLLGTWGYEQVMPPLIEYLDALLTGTGRDLDLQTFKLTDQLTGRLMGVRADMTPQTARIDAHYLKRESPVRLCYVGNVLRTRPEVFAGSRELLQLGAELFGHPGPESDIEVVRLMMAALAAALLGLTWAIVSVQNRQSGPISDRHGIRAWLVMPKAMRDFPAEKLYKPTDEFLYTTSTGSGNLRHWELQINTAREHREHWERAAGGYCSGDGAQAVGQILLKDRYSHGRSP